jgi:hypothetical protein
MRSVPSTSRAHVPVANRYSRRPPCAPQGGYHLARQQFPANLPSMRLTILRTLILVNAVATLAAGLVLFVLPGAIPSVVGITLAPDQAFVAWLLGAAEIGIAALCIGSVHSPSYDVLRLATTTLLVFHVASAVADGMALAQAWSLPIALNLGLRVVMVVLLVAFRLRRSAPSSR